MSTLTTTTRNGNVSRPNLNSWIDDWFGRDLGPLFKTNFNQGITLPAVNIKETGEAYFVEMAVPGMKKSDFEIGLDNQVLSISVDIKDEEEETTGNYTRREFGYASFKRSFTLPDTVEDGKIGARYDDGILRVHLPKKEEAKQKPVRNIEIS